MPEPDARRYSISEVSRMAELAPHVLRQWEDKISRLRPKRSRTGRRFYEAGDIEVIRTVKYLHKHKGMSLEAVNRYLNQEGHKGVLPKSPQNALELVGKIRAEAQAMIEQIERTTSPRA